jgi:cysteinyl-tRNA synthetase
MGKSLGNFITLEQFFTGNHELLDQAYTPMTVRFFILQAHYRGTVDFSNAALQAAEKAYERIMDGWHRLAELKAADTSSIKLDDYATRCAEAMNDDLNTAQVIATLFDACKVINQVNDGNATLTQADIDALKATFQTYLFDVLGVRDDATGNGEGVNLEPYKKAVDLLLEMRRNAKAAKDWATSDLIRDRLNEAGFDVKDTKDGFEWKVR